jgi:hypothetical protein
MVHGNGSAESWVIGERVERIAATEVTVDRSAVGRLEAERADLERAAVQRMQAEEATFTQSAIGIAQFERGTIRQSSAGVVVARSVACDEVHTMVLASPVVRGEVHTLLDLRSAVAVGVGIVLGKALLSLLGAVVRRAVR